MFLVVLSQCQLLVPKLADQTTGESFEGAGSEIGILFFLAADQASDSILNDQASSLAVEEKRLLARVGLTP